MNCIQQLINITPLLRETIERRLHSTAEIIGYYLIKNTSGLLVTRSCSKLLCQQRLGACRVVCGFLDGDSRAGLSHGKLFEAMVVMTMALMVRT